MASELNVGGITTTGNVGVGGAAETPAGVDTVLYVGSSLHAGIVLDDTTALPWDVYNNAGELKFNYNNTGSTLVISAAGLATFSNGIAFTQTGTAASGAATTSSTLDHYEEGTWTPVIGGGTCTNLVGKYTRVGNKVTVTVSVVAGEVASATNSQIIGLPFTCGTTRSTTSMIAYYHLLEVANPIGLLDSGTTVIYIVSNQAGSTWAAANFTNTASAYMHFSLTYFV